MPFDHLWVFLLLLIGIVVLPGLDMAYVLGSALSGGRRRGLAALAGVVLGGACHTVIAALGWGTVVRAAPGLFQLLLWTGAAYLAWMGWGLLRSDTPLPPQAGRLASSDASALARGAAVNLLNPKAYLFMLAIYPQFVRPEYGSMLLQAIVIGVLIALVQTVVYGAIALGAARARTSLDAGGPQQLWLARGVGLLLIGAAAWTATSA